MLGPVGAGARIDGGPWFRMDGGCAFCEGAKMDGAFCDGARMLGGPASAPPKAPGVNKDAMSASAALSASPQERGAALWRSDALCGAKTPPEGSRRCGARRCRAKDASRRLVAIGGAGASRDKGACSLGQAAYRGSRDAQWTSGEAQGGRSGPNVYRWHD